MDYVNQYIIELQLYRDVLKDYFPQNQHLIEIPLQINEWNFSKSQMNRVYENNIMIMKTAIHNYLESAKSLWLYDGMYQVPHESDKLNSPLYLNELVNTWKFVYDGILLMNILVFFKQYNKLSENNYNYSNEVVKQ